MCPKGFCVAMHLLISAEPFLQAQRKGHLRDEITYCLMTGGDVIFKFLGFACGLNMAAPNHEVVDWVGHAPGPAVYSDP